MAKKVIRNANFDASNKGALVGFAEGTKMAIVPANLIFEKDGETTERNNVTTFDRSGYANGFFVLINDGKNLKPYILPLTVVCGEFKAPVIFSNNVAYKSPVNKDSDNRSIFVSSAMALKSFELTFSATAALRWDKKDGSENLWTLWAVKTSDEQISVSDGVITWGDLTISQDDYDEAISNLIDERQ